MFSGNKKCNISLKGVKDTREKNAKEKSVFIQKKKSYLESTSNS